MSQQDERPKTTLVAIVAVLALAIAIGVGVKVFGGGGAGAGGGPVEVPELMAAADAIEVGMTYDQMLSVCPEPPIRSMPPQAWQARRPDAVLLYPAVDGTIRVVMRGGKVAEKSAAQQ